MKKDTPYLTTGRNLNSHGLNVINLSFITKYTDY